MEDEKITNNSLYQKQVKLLKTFLEHGTITKAQYDKSFNDLTDKMCTHGTDFHHKQGVI